MLYAASSSLCGEKHQVNEDRCVLVPSCGLFAVADGMGGHVHGAMASEIVATTLLSLTQAETPCSVEGLRQSIAHANRRIWTLAVRQRQRIGSTIAALIIQDSTYACLWAGDSRLYLIRGGAIRQLSRDDSEVQDLIDSGVLGPEEARTWPRRNVITKAVGTEEILEVSSLEGALQLDDRFVLCSDGLNGKVGNDEIRDLVLALQPKEACDRLAGLARQRGESDDVTIVTIAVHAGANGRVFEEGPGQW